MPSENSLLTRNVSRFFSGTVLSRATGLFRDVAMAYFFGSHASVASFMMAFRFSNLLRRMFGEGAMQSAFIPHFESLRADKSERAASFYKDLSAAITTILLLIILCIEGGILLWLHFGSPNLENAEVLQQTAIMFPSILFICLFGLNSALMECEGSYFASSVAPAIFNLFWIAGTFLVRGLAPAEAMPWLSLFIVIAYFFQWLMTLPKSCRFMSVNQQGFFLKKMRPFSLDVRKICKPLLLGILGVSAAQINSAVDPIFARAADLSGPAYLWYAIRIQQLPLALCGIAFSAALLPSLSRLFQSCQEGSFCQLLCVGLKRSLTLMIPATWALFAMGLSTVSLLFGRGDFGSVAIGETTLCLWGYALGLVPQTVVVLLASAFYARSNYRISTQGALFSLGLSTLLNTLFIFGWGWSSMSVAIATSLAAIANAVFLTIWLCKQMKIPLSELKQELKALLIHACKANLAAFLAALGAFSLGYLFFQDQSADLFLLSTVDLAPRPFLSQLLTLAGEGVLFIGIYYAICSYLEVEELRGILGFSKRAQKEDGRVDFS